MTSACRSGHFHVTLEDAQKVKQSEGIAVNTRKDAALTAACYKDFVAFVRRGLEQYGLTRADICKRSRRSLTASDIYAERVGIQTRGYDPLEPLKKGALPLRFVDNAFGRRATPRTARCVVWMLANCDGSRAWRKDHRGEDDPWLTEFRDRALQRDQIIVHPTVARADAPPPRAWIVAQDVSGIAALSADAVARTLRLSDRQRRDCEKAISARVQDERAAMAKSFSNWIWESERLLNVRVRETIRTSVPEGVAFEERLISVLRDSRVKGDPFRKAGSKNRVERGAGVMPFSVVVEVVPGEDVDAEDYGDAPTPREFLDALSFYFDLPSEVRIPPRLRK